mmetsp:Transcript_3249/g.2191  ORF Transcript_3249/g.2191 Transcript_3249/m.2191 type:complete len:128 (+) Transcript_3249:2803-3186(+)|eukprot:CAMPEP_0202959314 /NCGR_PEP_ID=MMETSP1396-20130829/3531_1 /ASSEMBLY_ACC=CAM_ASM_000872 /TAXON_ID= /ORGANISM="Pseudokeronopsis sp., Strain Brazil" /LENGTH=127 /DNA_ID=CAMNT_0049677817 /DNA_START=2802 /DNA_END=3185 /DNA_ORIENTATION=+
MSNDENEVYIEMAVGLGETLASANQPGTPYRLIFKKKEGEVSILSFANYSSGLFSSLKQKQLTTKPVDYTKIIFSQKIEALLAIGEKLGRIGVEIEKEYQSFQDIEGAIVESNGKLLVYVVQTRSQV